MTGSRAKEGEGGKEGALIRVGGGGTHQLFSLAWATTQNNTSVCVCIYMSEALLHSHPRAALPASQLLELPGGTVRLGNAPAAGRLVETGKCVCVWGGELRYQLQRQFTSL